MEEGRQEGGQRESGDLDKRLRAPVGGWGERPLMCRLFGDIMGTDALPPGRAAGGTAVLGRGSGKKFGEEVRGRKEGKG